MMIKVLIFPILSWLRWSEHNSLERCSEFVLLVYAVSVRDSSARTSLKIEGNISCLTFLVWEISRIRTQLFSVQLTPNSPNISKSLLTSPSLFSRGSGRCILHLLYSTGYSNFKSLDQEALLSRMVRFLPLRPVGPFEVPMSMPRPMLMAYLISRDMRQAIVSTSRLLPMTVF